MIDGSTSSILRICIGAAVLGMFLLGLACAPRQPAPPPELPPQEPPEPPVAEPMEPPPKSLIEAGKISGRWFTARMGRGADARLAFGWPKGAPSLKYMARSMSEAWPSAVLLSEIGIRAQDYMEAWMQLDPEFFDGLVWFTPEQESDHALAGALVSFHPTGSGEELRLRVTMENPIRLTDGGRSGMRPVRLLQTPESIETIAWNEEFEELWWASPSRIVRYSLSEGREKQGWSRTGPSTRQAPIPPVLRVASDPGSPVRVGFFDPVTGTGAWYGRSGGRWAKLQELVGFPLTPREARFLSAPWDPSFGEFRLLDYQSYALGDFRSMERIASPLGSILILDNRFGNLLCFTGNTLDPLIPPVDDRVAATAALGDRLFVVTGNPPVIRAFNLTVDRAWINPWQSKPLSAPVKDLTAGAMGGLDTLFLLLEEEGGDAVHTLEVAR